VPFHERADAEEFVRRAMEKAAPEGYEVWNLAIQLAEDPQFIGLIMLSINLRRERGGIGYELHPAHWSQGYMAEAIRCV